LISRKHIEYYREQTKMIVGPSIVIIYMNFYLVSQ
jgi:hypothetical protein